MAHRARVRDAERTEDVQEHSTPFVPRHSHASVGRHPHGIPEEEIGEAVFRYHLQQPLADQPQPPRYYLALRGRDPGETLLCRLRALTPWVQPLSQCRVSARHGVTDRTTEARGVIVQVARLAWVHATAVDAVGGYFITHQHAAGLRYRVVSEGSRWSVATVHVLWRA
jgi:hypothetical protein